MLLPPFWRGRGQHVPAGNRLARLRRILKASLTVRGYRERLNVVNLGTPALIDSIQDPDRALRLLEPIAFEQYCSYFGARRGPSARRPERGEIRNALLIPYGEARAGLDFFESEPDPAGATGDLYRLARSLEPHAQKSWKIDHALVIFSGVEAGVLSEDDRALLWRKYHVPLFEQFLGMDGTVIASECEVHAGLHVKPEKAILEVVDEELLLTSLTDEKTPALRVRTSLRAALDRELCDCGRVEPRIMGLSTVLHPRVSKAVA